MSAKTTRMAQLIVGSRYSCSKIISLLKKADNPSEVAAVLAHEVQHVEQRHALKNMISSAGIATAVIASILHLLHALSEETMLSVVLTDAASAGNTTW